MARLLNRLSPKFIENIDKPGRYADGGGLYLQVAPSKDGGVTKAWLFRYMRGHTSRAGKPTSREMGLGPLSTSKRDGFITTKEARDRAYGARESLKAGIDPLETKRALRLAKRIQEAKAVTFSQCAAEYIEAHKAGWKGEKHTKLWKGSLKRYVEPVFGALPVASVDTALVLKALKPIWGTKTQSAAKLRMRIELIINWATTHGYREGENPARWRGHLKNVLPDPGKVAKVTHLPAMPYAELPAFMAELRQDETVAARALEWTILSAVRSDNTFGLTWEAGEVDAAKKCWTIPAERMKADADHRVPLTDRMLEILSGLSRDTKYVFSGENPKKKLPHEKMLKALKAIRPGLTVHGFRSTFKDWASEQTAYANEVSEMALAHAVGDKVENAYRRTDLFDKRRLLMEDWATYCGGR
ncbi:integrase arm-type DNA-binding domain-containing protein [Bradyrhizobium sp. B097]|uniref:tyrosine-type recombinase/integrase n=1 Tax=Bradyrhizobium sp. B097 TaxID=3140244 RepID=UPI00318344DA